MLTNYSWKCYKIDNFEPILKQAGAELGQAQLQLELGLGFTFIKVCCITLMIGNYNYIL